MSDDYLGKQQRKFEDFTEGYRKETNEIFRELVEQLILVGTVLLSVSAFIFNIQDISTKLYGYDKIILLLAWIFIIISLIMGISQLFIDHYFMARWTRAKSNVVEGIARKTITEANIQEKVLEEQSKLPKESCTVPVWIQAITITIGIILLAVVMGTLLFAL